MTLIGAYVGEYNGNKYAKIITTEDFERGGSRGKNAVISKADYKLVSESIIPEWGLYENAEVLLSYDRFGKVQAVTVK